MHEPSKASSTVNQLMMNFTNAEGRPGVLAICARDDAAQRISDLLSSLRIQATVTISAPMGLMMAVDRTPSVIILDTEMPGLSGAAMLKLLRAHPATNAIPLILITGETAILADSATVLPADFTDEQLLAAVKIGLGSHPASGEDIFVRAPAVSAA